MVEQIENGNVKVLLSAQRPVLGKKGPAQVLLQARFRALVIKGDSDAAIIKRQRGTQVLRRAAHQYQAGWDFRQLNQLGDAPGKHGGQAKVDQDAIESLFEQRHDARVIEAVAVLDPDVAGSWLRRLSKPIAQ